MESSRVEMERRNVAWMQGDIEIRVVVVVVVGVGDSRDARCQM